MQEQEEKQMKCPKCNEPVEKAYAIKERGAIVTQYFVCRHCDYLFKGEKEERE